MKLKDILEKYNFSDKASEIFLSSGIEELYPPQAEAIKRGVLEGKNVLMSVPTAAGKTLIAELCMVKSILENADFSKNSGSQHWPASENSSKNNDMIHSQARNSRCLYIAPLKALASEKYNDFKKKYSSLGIEVGLAIGDLDTPGKYLNKYQIIIATAEKVDSLLRSQAQWLINGLSVVILDEIHFINDGSRGPVLEILTARIRQLNPSVQILALSATVRNAQQIAGWLNAELVHSTFRPIPLKEGVYFNRRIIFNEHGTRMITEDEVDDLSNLTVDTLRGKGQVLVFVNSRRSAQAASAQIAKSVFKVLNSQERSRLVDLSKKIAGSGSDVTKICRKLAGVITSGVAFHHAGLKPNQRELIEENFKGNLIKAICCTPTLAAGVNLPARRAIIRDCKRYESGIGQAYIPTSEYKQCAGRAGRPQYDDYGEAVLIAKSHSETSTLFEKYINAQSEPVTSKLADESALRIHILSSIAGGYVHDVKGMLDFIAHTFLHYQKQHYNLLDLITEIFDFLHREKFVDKSGYRFFPTPLGNLTSRLYIDPMTAITLRDGLAKIKPDQPFSAVGILHLIACCPDNPKLNVGKGDSEDLEKFASHFEKKFVLTPDNWSMVDDLYEYLSTLKTCWMLLQWVQEEKEENICDQFNIGPGDIFRHIESVQWLLYAAGQIASLTNKRKLTFDLEDLRNRVHYGIKEELLEIVQLRGIGRIRARILFNKGYKKLSDFKHASVEELSKVNQIGKALAQDILNQISEPAPKKKFRQSSLSTSAATTTAAVEPGTEGATTEGEWED